MKRIPIPLVICAVVFIFALGAIIGDLTSNRLTVVVKAQNNPKVDQPYQLKRTKHKVELIPLTTPKTRVFKING